MGRGKIEIKRIENPTSRQVTFSKRRGGLLKKAHELAVLCDAEVALIIFSSTGKLFEFASAGSMQAILERYSRSSEGAQQPGNNSEFMGREVVRLRQQLDHLENSQRHMLGENLSVLTVPDLLLLEQQLDMGVSRIRARKNQLLLEEIDNLRRKEHDLQQVNEELRQKALELQQMPVEWQKLYPGLFPWWVKGKLPHWHLVSPEGAHKHQQCTPPIQTCRIHRLHRLHYIWGCFQKHSLGGPVDKCLSKVKLRQKVAALGSTPLSGCESTLLGKHHYQSQK